MEPRPRSSASSTEHIVVDVPPPEALLEIGNLIRIRGLQDVHTTRLQVALKEWERSSDLFTKRRDTYKKDQNVLRNEIYQGVGFFSAFQGLLFTAVAQSTLLSCKNLIFPFLLSLIATVTTVALVFQKYSDIRYWQSCISEGEMGRKELARRVCRLRRKGTAFDFHNDANEIFRPAPKRTILSVLISSASYGVGIISILIIFGGLCLLAMHRILCDSGSRCSR